MDPNQLFMNCPVRVEMMGFESDTARLQANGWQIAAEQLPEFQHLRIMIHHPQMDVYGVSDIAEFEYMCRGMGRLDYIRGMCLRMSMHKQRNVISTQNPYRYFKMVDASRGRCQESRRGSDSQTENIKTWSVEDGFVFPLARPDQEVIVKPQEVPELLKLILSKQEPQVKAALDNQRRREARGEVEKALATRTHAQIISIGE